MTEKRKYSSNLDMVRQKIEKGEVVIGTHIKIGNQVVTDILCNVGFDIMWIDSEHGPMDKKDINQQVITLRGAGLAPFVRVPWNDPVLVKPILEMGPAGIVFPMISSVEEAKRAVEACRYPPKGIRGFGPMKANNYGTMDSEEYLKLSQNEPWVILQIEHYQGVRDLKDIVKVEGVDSIVIGPNDLSGSIGKLGQTRHPEMLKLMDEYAAACREVDIPFGTSIGFDQQNVTEWIERGVNWICVDGDTSYLLNGGIDTLNNTRELLEKSGRF